MSSQHKTQLAVKWIAASKGDEPHALVIRKSDGFAVDCSCGHRVQRGRKRGEACKHMLEHNSTSPHRIAKCERSVSSISHETQRASAPLQYQAFSFLREEQPIT